MLQREGPIFAQAWMTSSKSPAGATRGCRTTASPERCPPSARSQAISNLTAALRKTRSPQLSSRTKQAVSFGGCRDARNTVVVVL
jgi:hypothetical protein